MGMVWTHGRLATLLNAKKEESRFIPKNSQQLNRNRTCAENRNNWPTIEQQPTNKRTNIPTDPKKKQHIDEKKKTDNIPRRRTAPFLSISPPTSAVMKKKSKQTLGLVASSFPFLFLCPDSLSFHVSKN